MIEPAAWMHPEAGWTNKNRSAILPHCRKDGPQPIPLYTAEALATARREAAEEMRERAAKVLAGDMPVEVFDVEVNGQQIINKGENKFVRLDEVKRLQRAYQAAIRALPLDPIPAAGKLSTGAPNAE